MNVSFILLFYKSCSDIPPHICDSRERWRVNRTLRRRKYGPHVKRTVRPLLAMVDYRRKAEKSVWNMTPPFSSGWSLWEGRWGSVVGRWRERKRQRRPPHRTYSRLLPTRTVSFHSIMGMERTWILFLASQCLTWHGGWGKSQHILQRNVEGTCWGAATVGTLCPCHRR